MKFVFLQLRNKFGMKQIKKKKNTNYIINNYQSLKMKKVCKNIKLPDNRWCDFHFPPRPSSHVSPRNDVVPIMMMMMMT